MEELSEKLMDVHDDLAKEKVLVWISNLLRQEERALVEPRAGEGDDQHKSYYYTQRRPKITFAREELQLRYALRFQLDSI